jgi:hypothetical protein
MFVVDASIFPGMPSTNPSALIVTAAEHASDLILALPANTAVAHYSQCGGLYYTGSQVCTPPYTCTYGNAYYWQVCSPTISFSDLYLRSRSAYNLNIQTTHRTAIWTC